MGLSNEEQLAEEEKRQADIAQQHEERRARLGHDQPQQSEPSEPRPGPHPDDEGTREGRQWPGEVPVQEKSDPAPQGDAGPSGDEAQPDANDSVQAEQQVFSPSDDDAAQAPQND